MSQIEHVAILPRTFLDSIGIKGGVTNIDLRSVGLIPYGVVGIDKDKMTLEDYHHFLGCPFVEPHIQFVSPDGKIFTIQENGIVKIGFGGSILLEDSNAFENVFLKTLYNSIARQVKDIAGIDLIDHQMNVPKTTIVDLTTLQTAYNVKLPVQVHLTKEQMEKFHFASESVESQSWRTIDELKSPEFSNSVRFEQWSQFAIDTFVLEDI